MISKIQSWWKKHIFKIFLAGFLLFLSLFLVLEIRAQMIYKKDMAYYENRIADQFERAKAKAQTTTIYLKEVKQENTKVAVNSEWADPKDNKKTYLSLFQADPIQSWSQQPPHHKIQLNLRNEIKSETKEKEKTKNAFMAQKVGIKAKAGISKKQAQKAMEYLQLKNQDSDSSLANAQRIYYEEKYQVSKYKQLPICVVIPSFMNTEEDRYISNMKSILQQQYSNYHIVFIDDASEDKTGQKMQIWANEQRISKDKLKIIINSERKMAMPNIYEAAQIYCKPYEIFIIVDGDDEIIGKQVFKHFNQIFSVNDVWVAYSNFIKIKGNIGFSRAYDKNTIETNNYRDRDFFISHLRAFFTKLLTKVDVEDLQDEEGNWFRAANDVAMYLPILQMAHRHIIYSPQISYMYNSNTGLNNHETKKKEQKQNQKKIKAKTHYQPLEQLFSQQQKIALQRSLGSKIKLYEDENTVE